MLDHAFEELDMHKVSCEVFANNPAPVGMHRRMGFVQEGTFRDHVLDDGNWIDVVRMSLLRTEWEAQRSKIRNLLKRLVGPDAIGPRAPKRP